MKPTNRAWAAQRAADRLEDLLWMVDSGESLTGAATRLCITVDALVKWLERRHMSDVTATLRARDPIDPAKSLSEMGRIGAEARWTA